MDIVDLLIRYDQLVRAYQALTAVGGSQFPNYKHLHLRLRDEIQTVKAELSRYENRMHD